MLNIQSGTKPNLVVVTAPFSLTLHRTVVISVRSVVCVDKTGTRTYLLRHRGFNSTFSRGPAMSRHRKPLKQTYMNLFERDRENVASSQESQPPEAAPHQAITWTNFVFGTLTFSPAQFYSKYITCSRAVTEFQYFVTEITLLLLKFS